MNVKQLSRTIGTIVDNYNHSLSVVYTGSPSKEVQERFQSDTNTLVDSLTEEDAQLLPKIRSRKIGRGVLKGIATIVVGTALGYGVGMQIGGTESVGVIAALGGLVSTLTLIKQLPSVGDYLSLSHQIEATYEERNQ